MFRRTHRLAPLLTTLLLAGAGAACNEAPSQGGSAPLPIPGDTGTGDSTDPGLDTALPDPDAEADASVDALPSTDVGGEADTEDTGAPTDASEGDAAETTPEPDATGDTTPPIGDLADPWERGPYTFNTSQIEVPNSTGGTFDARLYVPASGPTSGPWPVVIFNHGFQLNDDRRTVYFASYGEHLASHGFVGLFPVTGDGILSARTHVQLANDTVQLLDWIEAQAAGARAGIFDASRIGAGGHSRGGKQAIFAATLDERIRASFNVDPVDSAPPANPLAPSNPADFPSVAPERMGDFRIPGGFVGGGLGATGAFPGAPACAPPDDNHAQYWAAAAGPAWRWDIAEAGHLEFADACGIICRTCRSGNDGEWVRRFSRALMVAFYQTHLGGDERYQDWLEGPVFEGLVGRRDVSVQTRNTP